MDNRQRKSKLVVGCGYLGNRVARRWLASGCQVTVVTRHEARAAEFAAVGLRPIVADVTQPETLRPLSEQPVFETVLFAVGYDPSSQSSRHQVYVEGLAAVLDSLPSSVARFLFVSSTGVYGQTDGRLVDEDTPVEPVREAGQAFLAAEKLLAAHPLGNRSIILRLAGLYGPRRIPRRADLLAGRPIVATDHGLVNLIHVDDAAEVVLAAETRAVAPRTYLVADGHPVARREYYGQLAQLLGLPSPRFTDPHCDNRLAERGGSNKRVNNARMIRELGVRLRYPSYREGLAAIVAAEEYGR